jgi:hypothetical protein
VTQLRKSSLIVRLNLFYPYSLLVAAPASYRQLLFWSVLSVGLSAVNCVHTVRQRAMKFYNNDWGPASNKSSTNFQDIRIGCGLNGISVNKLTRGMRSMLKSFNVI